LNGLVFLLIGLQLPWILASIHEYKFSTMVMYGAIFSILLILLRIVWVFPGSWLANFVRCRMHHIHEKPPRPREVFVVGWTGMRGVVALAAALSLPTLLANGNPFPQRDLIVFLTFTVILVTLVLQGVTLAPLVRKLGLADTAGTNCEELEARRIVMEAALSHLASVKETRSGVPDEIFDDIIGHYQHRLASLEPAQANEEHVSNHFSYLEISRETAGIERDTAVRLRNEGRINDQVLRRIERELDLNESRYADTIDE